MTHDDTTLQAAIDAAFQTNGEKYCGNLVTHLVDANRGAQRNAHINQSLATKLNEALKRAEKWEEEARRYCQNADYWRNRAEADSVSRPSLSRLRPIAEAGPVPEGCVRTFAWLAMSNAWCYTASQESWVTHCTDIMLPTSEAEQKADPYARPA